MRSISVITAAKNIRDTQYYPVVLFATLFGALLLRCWPRLISPQIWVEDGTQVLHGFISEGWTTFFQPINGYWQLIAKLISAIALSISIYYYPLISTILTCLFTVCVGLAVALSPTFLRGKFFCALAIFLVPINAEIFGLPLYAFWWAAVLLLLLTLWDEKRTHLCWRIGFLVVGGLSSPVIIMILPLLYYRAFLYRSARAEQYLALLGTPMAVLQITFIVAGAAARFQSPASLGLYIVPKFFGGFLLGNIGGNLWWSWLFGLGLIAYIAVWLRRDVSHKGRWVLLYLLVGVIALSVVRVNPTFLTTYGVGPRYFFYPFVVLFWICIQIYYAANTARYRSAAMGIIALATLNMLPVTTRFHDDLAWQAHVRSCRLFPEYNIPVEFDGTAWRPGWELALNGKDCDDFLRRDSLISASRLERQPTFAYAMQRVNWALREAPAELLTNTMSGGGFPSAARPGYRIIGSYDAEGAAVGEVRLRLKKGASVLYRSGASKEGQRIQIEGHEQQFVGTVPATNDWVRLVFSNMNLPAEFVVRIQDTGMSRGQWSAIAVPDIDSPR